MKRFLMLMVIAAGLAMGKTRAQVVDSVASADSLSMMYRELPDVVVSGEKPIAKIEQGKLVYDLPRLLEKIPAENAFDAVSKIPGVFVQDDKINFGGSGVTLILDGKVSSMDYAQIVSLLKSMPAERLEKAEMMMSAPARYHVRGSVLNIVTKKPKGTEYFSGQLQGSYIQSKYGSANAKGNIIFAKDKLTVDANYSFTYGKGYGETAHNAKHPLNGTTVDYHDSDEMTTKGYSHEYRVGLDYQFAKMHQLNLSYNGSHSNTDANFKTNGTSVSKQATEIRATVHNADLNYSLPFGLSLSASYTHYSTPKSQLLDGEMYDEHTYLTASSNQTINKLHFTADQIHNLKNKWNLSYGAKLQLTNNNSFQSTLDENGDALPGASSSVDLNERIVSGYVGVDKQFGKGMSLDLSATVENYNSDKWNEWRVYPTMSFLWRVNPKHLLNLTFNSNAYYPSYWSTMSHIQYTSIYSEIWGNPDLKPSSSYNTSLMWQINNRYTLVAFANLSPNFFVQLPYQPSDRMAVIMREVNFDHRNSFGLQASAMFNAGSWLNGNLFAVLNYNKDKCNNFFDISFDRHKVSAILGGNVSAKLCKKPSITLTLNPFFQSEAIQGVYDISPMFRLNATLKWISNDGKWNVTLAGNNITNDEFHVWSTVDNQNFEMFVRQNWVNASLTCVYKFGNYKEKSTKKVDTSRMGY